MPATTADPRPHPAHANAGARPHASRPRRALAPDEVLAALADHAEPAPAVRALAAAMGAEERAVRFALALLERKGQVCRLKGDRVYLPARADEGPRSEPTPTAATAKPGGSPPDRHARNRAIAHRIWADMHERQGVSLRSLAELFELPPSRIRAGLSAHHRANGTTPPARTSPASTPGDAPLGSGAGDTPDHTGARKPRKPPTPPPVRIRLEELAAALGATVEAIGPALGRLVAAWRWGLEGDEAAGWTLVIPGRNAAYMGIERSGSGWRIDRPGKLGDVAAQMRASSAGPNSDG